MPKFLKSSSTKLLTPINHACERKCMRKNPYTVHCTSTHTKWIKDFNTVSVVQPGKWTNFHPYIYVLGRTTLRFFIYKIKWHERNGMKWNENYSTVIFAGVTQLAADADADAAVSTASPSRICVLAFSNDNDNNKQTTVMPCTQYIFIINERANAWHRHTITITITFTQSSSSSDDEKKRI